ncbi:FecR domain-containing protein [Rhodoferax sp.]|uniref:FecR domain-containing protein n=1 Tax=Rhodoferax sp. TaxID=50421 RepID=UPI0026119B47|nr:FecR domain-containing protein [Rhodoferax sp.]MDD5480461.1 FecR domain-containing protein [Rhodoferax sp.]
MNTVHLSRLISPIKWSLLGAMLATHLASFAAEPTLAYTVKSGDELIKMAEASFTNVEGWKQVAEVNRLKNPNAIHPGQVLQIPMGLLKTRAQPAQLVSSSGDVRVAGERVSAGSFIQEGAELQTGANASAQLLLPDQSRVTLMPNTTARLTTSQMIDFGKFDANRPPNPNWFTGLISLSRGALDVLASKLPKRTTPLRVETPTSVVGVRGTVFRVAYEDPSLQNARTEVLDGLVRADNAAQKTGADLPKGTGTVLNPSVQRIKVSPLLKAPKLTTAVVHKPQASWPVPSLTGAQRFRVQVSGFQDFSNIVHEQVVALHGQADFSGLPNGLWHLRVRGIDADTLEGFNAMTQLQVLLPQDAHAPTAQWQAVNPRLQVADGKPVLQLDALGLDASHIVLASIHLNHQPYVRVVKALVNPVAAVISLPLDGLDVAQAHWVNFTVTQADGALLSPASYRLEGLSTGTLKWTPLASPLTQSSQKSKPSKGKTKRQRSATV